MAGSAIKENTYFLILVLGDWFRDRRWERLTLRGYVDAGDAHRGRGSGRGGSQEFSDLRIDHGRDHRGIRASHNSGEGDGGVSLALLGIEAIGGEDELNIPVAFGEPFLQFLVYAVINSATN